MPISSGGVVVDKKKVPKVKVIDLDDGQQSDNFLTIEPALPLNDRKRLYKRCHSTLNPSSISRDVAICDSLCLQGHSDGTLHVARTETEKQANPDRISLDRKGLTSIPVIDGELTLRLLSLQHNLINNLDGFRQQTFPTLVFLDIYDNQLDQIGCLDGLENLRVLLMGKNRLKRIEGLKNLKKIEVLDLHGNQITQVAGLIGLNELKVLNLAGNQIKFVGISDLQGLVALQELNLRRNRLKKLLGFGETPNLFKLFLSNNDLQNVEDISSIAKLSNLKDISIDNNPVFLGGDCVSFLVSYLPQLLKLNSMQITDQVRKAAMAWRRNKESTNAAFMDLTSDVCLNIRREEVISNARTNWELLRSQTKCLTTKNTNSLGKTLKNLKPDTDFILTSFGKQSQLKAKSKPFASITTKVPVYLDKKMIRTNSQDTETSSSNTSSTEFFKLPPILVPIINKMEQRNDGIKPSESLSSMGPNIDSSVSSLGSLNESSSTSSSDTESEVEDLKVDEKVVQVPDAEEPHKDSSQMETASNISSVSTVPSSSSNETVSSSKQSKRSIKSAASTRVINPKLISRAATAKPRKQSPAISTMVKDREQGGDYLIEICGRYLNVYGQCALRFIEKSWSQSKAHDVNSVKFNYVNFNGITSVLNKLKMKFPNIENFYFKENNIYCLGQLNALAEVQGLTSLSIESEGNPIMGKNWRSYAIYRLSHWGLKNINDVEITDGELQQANDEYQSLSDLVLWSLPDVLLQPLLVRLRLDINHGVTEQNVKKWLLSADPALKSVVSKEALQWKKSTSIQDDTVLRQKAKQYISSLLDEMCNAINKLRLLDKEWPTILHEFVRNTLVDYTQLDLYMKQKIQELNK